MEGKTENALLYRLDSLLNRALFLVLRPHS
jgi:hypothetical protein